MAPIKMQKWKQKDKLKNATVLYIVSSKNNFVDMNGHNI
jgi:hypothetical protein